jgi:uncharacterized protein (TIGR00290 family)
MNSIPQTFVSWSTGKDSAWMLYRLQHASDAQVVGLFTTVNRLHQRVAMHAVPAHLLHAQAKAIGLPLKILEIPDPCSNEQYGEVMANFLSQARAQGVEAIAFGDLFLEDLRRYRETQMQSTGITPLFPLWGTSTSSLSRDLIEHGFSMFVTCVDPRVVPRDLAGQKYDRDFVNALPQGVDPCGENGEFHTFVYGGPIFKNPLHVEIGKIVERDGFVFADVVEPEPELEPSGPGHA